MKITWEQLKEAAGDEEYIVDILEVGLAPWLIDPARREELGVNRPRIPGEQGSLVALFCKKEPLPALASGFGLPLRWSTNKPARPRLPAEILERAEHVKALLNSPGWYLDLALPGYDLSELRMPAESIDVPLAVGLKLALLGGSPSPYVLSTGKIENGYVEAVDGIAEKVKAADDLLQQDPLYKDSNRPGRRLFVPSGNVREAEEAIEKLSESKRPPIHVESFLAGKKLEKNLKTMLAYLDQPPLEQSIEALIDFANRPHITSDPPRRGDLYKEYLVRALGASIREDKDRYLSEWPEWQEVGRLLLPVSIYTDNAILSLVTHRPKEVAFVFSKESERKNKEALLALAQELGIKPFPVLLPIEERDVSLEDIQKMAKWLATCPQGERMVDLTPGTREMSTAVMVAGEAVKAHIVYFWHKNDENSNRILYGTERVSRIHTSKELRALL